MSDHWYDGFFTGLMLELWRKAVPPEATAAEADWLEQALALTPGAAVLDVPCGHGRLALPLAARGYRVTGIDIAAEALDTARADAREAAGAAAADLTWVQGDMRDLPRLLADAGAAAPFDAAYCMGNSFGYMDRPGTRRFLADLAAALRPGGRLAIDSGMLAESQLPQLDERMWMPVDDLLLLVEHDYVMAESRLDTQYTVIKGDQRETGHAAEWIFTMGELTQMLADAGFTVLERAADLNGTPYALGSDRLLLVAERGG